MNSINIAGNITKDAEMRYMANGDPIASFGVADNQGKDKPAIFWNCSLFGKRAESLSSFLNRGQPVTVSGTVTEREWTDKEGNKRKSMDVRVNDIALQGGKRESSDAGSGRPANASPRPQPNFSDMDSDIPF